MFQAVFCFDGDGVVSMWDGSTKRVRDVRIGKLHRHWLTWKEVSY